MPKCAFKNKALIFTETQRDKICQNVHLRANKIIFLQHDEIKFAEMCTYE